MALTERIVELERKYKELFAREGVLDTPTPLQEERERFLDYLLDEVLFDESIFEAFSVIGSTEHPETGIVLKYQSQPGYASMHEEVGNVSHYQFMAFQQRSPFPWLPDFLVLRDRNTSEVRLYLVNTGTTHTTPFTIGLSKDLELSYELCYQKSEGGSAVDRGGVKVKEVTRSQLCDPRYILKMEVGGGEGRAFNLFYYGLQELTTKIIQKIDELRGSVTGAEINKKYRTLQALAERDS